MIKNEYVKQTLSGDSQEINIYKSADDENGISLVLFRNLQENIQNS